LSKGTHVVLDCYDVPASLCLDDKYLMDTAARLARECGANVINTSRYHFGHNSPPGCTVFVMLDESHISVHTYASDGRMAIDIFTCGKTDAREVAERLKQELRLTNFKEKCLDRF